MALKDGPEKIGEYKNDQPIIIIPFPNGGWCVEQTSSDMGVMNSKLGAYTNTGDMLEALGRVLD